MMGRSSLCTSLIAALSISLAISSAALSKPGTTEAEDAAAVIRYTAQEGSVPAWAGSPTLLLNLAVEARAHGLTLLKPDPAKLSTGQAGMLAVLELARSLATGVVLPSSVQADWTIPVPLFDAETALKEMAVLADPLPWLRSLAPSVQDYARLRKMLGHYHAIVESGGWPAVPDGPTLRVGVVDQRVPILKRRLKIGGDLASDAQEGPEFDTSTRIAVKGFQARHALEIDGAVARVTLSAMNVTALERYQQISANLERWRWLPRQLPETRIVVNAAAASLQLVEDGRTTVELRTIVGTPQHPTPVLRASVVSLLFNPPWDIPTAIAEHEIRPMARRNAEYLEREGIVTSDGGWRLRQLPGPRNALGQIKFEMPNPFDIYLHDTPSRNLFDRNRRYSSHGCIRVQYPLELASRLFHDGERWPVIELERAIKNGSTFRVRLPSAVPIFVLYLTAFVDADGTAEFRTDVYGRDRPLIAALFPDAVAMVAARPAEMHAVGCRPS